MSVTSNPLFVELTPGCRKRLERAVRNDDTLDREAFDRIWLAIGHVADGAQLPYDLTDLGDGTTDEEIVSVALDYYGIR